MLFVSVSPELTVTIRHSLRRAVVNTLGQSDYETARPTLYANFKPKSLDFAQRIRADLRFKQINPTHPYGATPYRDGGIMGSQFSDEVMETMPEAFGGYDPVHMLGKFDTASDIKYEGQLDSETPTEADVRRLVETKLMADSSLNGPQGFILLDDVAVAKPWPNYPVEGQGRHMRIIATVKEMGIDPAGIIAFESSLDKPGKGVIDAMRALLDERNAEDAEQDALSVEIPA